MNYPSKPWAKFFAKVNEIDSVKISEWKEYHLLFYFAKRYSQIFGSQFAYSFAGPPSRCTEIVMIKKIWSMLNANHAYQVKDYIDWVFDHKVIPNKTKIKSLGYFMTSGIGNEYRFYLKDKNKITKTQDLPELYKQAVADLGVELNTYGDLAFAQQAVKEAPQHRENYAKALNRLYILGLDSSLLEKIV